MLPSSKKYLEKSGFSSRAAGWVLLACFISGVLGIQIISRLLHHHIPSHTVNCDHTHKEATHDHSHHHSRTASHNSPTSRRHSHNISVAVNGKASESTPLLPSENGGNSRPLILKKGSFHVGLDGAARPRSRGTSDLLDRRPSMAEVPQRLMSFVQDKKNNCDEEGPCYGYSDPCGHDCFGKMSPTRTPINTRHPTLIRVATENLPHRQSLLVPETLDEEDLDNTSTYVIPSPGPKRVHDHESDEACESDEEDLEAQHHHHVPENAFLSIGLQTSIAIAIHKLPEGFITYATNHANPSLGFSVFTALFIHNISEGFALALPLFLALHSRVRAMFWAFLLGGVSQPLGAGIAALWFKIAGVEGHLPSSAVYGCMFAITAGIMASVALTLLLEAMSLNHNRNLCVAFGFTGMFIMGMSNALTSG